jgi:formylglycine-generating enzyme required for sulfatase activity
MAETPSFNEVRIEIRRLQGGSYSAALQVVNPLYGPVSGTCDGSIFTDNQGVLEWISSGSDIQDGQRLFEWLFKDEALKTAWNHISGMHPQRRIRLLLDASSPELHRLPWEVLPESSAAGALALSSASASPFSRYLSGAWDPVSLIQERPIRILAAIANPENLKEAYGLEPVPAGDFGARLQQAVGWMEEAGQVELALLPEPCTLPSLAEELNKGYHILHFTGHGAFSSKFGAVLFMSDEHNQVAPVKVGDFAAMLANQLKHIHDLGRPTLRLATLASCQTSLVGFLDAFGGFAQALVRQGLPAALAMRDLVDQDTALIFTDAFFRRLLEHGLVDLACNEARSAVLSARRSGAFIPVLFSRLTDNQLVQPVAFKPPTERQPYEPELVRIQAGKFYMGASPDDLQAETWEKPGGRLQQQLPAYWIGRYPVTNQEYAEFVQQTDHPAPRLNWEGQQPKADKLRHPVAGVSWWDAQAYCDWLSQQTGRRYRLPSEAEWEKAARGDQDDRIYPWGSQWQDGRCHTIEANPADPEAIPDFYTARVDQYPAQSPSGCFDMLGNVREWTNTIWGDHLTPEKSRFPYPWKVDGREKAETSQKYFKTYRVYRGGGAADPRSQLRCSARDWDDQAATYMCGFRVVRER